LIFFAKPSNRRLREGFGRAPGELRKGSGRAPRGLREGYEGSFWTYIAFWSLPEPSSEGCEMAFLELHEALVFYPG